MKNIKKLEFDLITLFKNTLNSNLVSLVVDGSYGHFDFVDGYSDYDLLVFVKNKDTVPDFNLNLLCQKYKMDIQYVIREYSEFNNRIKDNNKTTRFLSNIDLIKIKKTTRLLWGKNIRKEIPPISTLIKRDLSSDLRECYYHATNQNPDWNIFIREPRKWVNYIINMSNVLLLSLGVVCKKDQIPTNLHNHFPDFKVQKIVKKALYLRKSKKVLSLGREEATLLKKELSLFLESYKNFIF